MSNTGIRKTASKGLAYGLVEKFSLRAGQFIIGIILANILSPSDFGTIAILTFFIGISHVLIDSGFGKALIQNTTNSAKDYSTIFFFNLSISALLYGILFLCAPFVADFYDNDQITPLLRVISLSVIIEALALVPRVKLQINLDFKTIALINTSSVIIGGICAIPLALLGYGIWALVAQYIIRAFIESTFYTLKSHWKPAPEFSVLSFKKLYKFGSNILLANVYAEIVNNISKLIIGKAYSPISLGHYSRAKNLTSLSADTVSQTIQMVMFPILSKIKNDNKKLLSAHKEIIKTGAFFSIPFITILYLIADPLIKLILNDQWLEVIPLLQIMVFTRILFPLNAGNLNLLNVIGRSDLYLKVNLAKLPLIIINLIITIPMGIKALVIGQVICSFLYHFINSFWIGKIFDYGALKQLIELKKIVLATLLMFACLYFIQDYLAANIIKLFANTILGSIIYIGLSKLFKIPEYNKAKDTIRNILTKS